MRLLSRQLFMIAYIVEVKSQHKWLQIYNNVLIREDF